MKSTYSVIFYLKREKLKKDGTYPVMGRIGRGRERQVDACSAGYLGEVSGTER